MIAVRRLMGGCLYVTDEVQGLDTIREITRFDVRSGLSEGRQAHLKSVSVRQSLWSRMASLRATATRARLPPLAAARALPQV